MADRLHLKPKYRRMLEALLQEHLPDVEVWAYGSRVTGRSHDGSDLDLVLRGPDLKEIPAGQLGDFEEAVQDSNIPFLVEAKDWTRLPERFHQEIERDYVVLVENAGHRASSSEWPVVTVEDISEKVAMGPFGSSIKVSTFVPKGVPIISGQHLHGFRVDDAPGFNYITEEHAQRLANANVRRGDIVFTHAGNIGQVSYIPDDSQFEHYVISQRQFYMRCNRLKAIPEFVSYYFNSPEGRHKLLANASQVGVPSIAQPVTYLRTIEIPLPPLPEQRAIAHVLGTLDDKIELNRRMNETLEAMARALFKSWFIDFDPVRAKMALKQQTAQPITPPLRGSRQAKGTSPQARRWGDIQRQYTQHTLQNAQTLRESRTDAEGLLWQYLRDKQLDGHKFRRQQPIGPYIIDFACMSHKLLIELDGGQHADQHTYDKKRDKFLRAKGYHILRFWNNEVFDNCFEVLENILTILDHHSPLEGESASQGRQPAGAPVGGDESGMHPPPHQPAPSGSASATPSSSLTQDRPQGGSDWTVERARAYLDGMDKDIAALFPDQLVDSELGEIPEGWEVSTIGQEVDVVGGSTPSTKDPAFWNGTINWATPKDLSSLESPVLVETSRKITEKGLDKISSGLLPRETVLLSSRAPIGYLVISDVPVAINQGFIAMKCQKRLSTTYAWLWTAANMTAILENANGSTFQEISKSNFRPLRVIVPHVSVRKTYDKLMQRLYDRIVKNERQSRTLVSLRDALLPKLVSGKLRVKDSTNL